MQTTVAIYFQKTPFQDASNAMRLDFWRNVTATPAVLSVGSVISDHSNQKSVNVC